MNSKPIFTAKDIDTWVTTKSQGELLKDFNLCKYELATIPPEDLSRFYWQDKLEAIALALTISLTHNFPLSLTAQTINDLRQQVFYLEQRLLALVTQPKVKGVRGL